MTSFKTKLKLEKGGFLIANYFNHRSCACENSTIKVKKEDTLNIDFSSLPTKESFESENDDEKLPENSDIGVKIEKSGFYHTIFNYVNSIIGAGIICIPYAIYQAGIGLGVILLILVALITDYSLRLLVRASIQAEASTYPKLMQAAYGRVGYYVLTVMQFMFPFIAMTSYNVIIADNLPQILISIFNISNDSIIANRHLSLVLATIFITLPLSLLRKISRLSKISFLSLVLVFGLALIIFFRAFFLDVQATAEAYSFFNSRFVQATGVMSLTFMCHHNVFLLFSAMKSPCLEKWNIATHLSIFVSWLFVISVGLSGYLSFTGYSQGDVLVNYCLDDITGNSARSLYIITIMLTYPIQCFVTREIIENLIFASRSTSILRQYLLTIVIVVLIFSLSCITRCLKVFLEINGVFVAVPLSYIFPSLIFLKVDKSPILSQQKISVIFLTIAGLAVSIIGAYYIVVDLIEGVDCIDVVELPYCNSSNGTTI